MKVELTQVVRHWIVEIDSGDHQEKRETEWYVQHTNPEWTDFEIENEKGNPTPEEEKKIIQAISDYIEETQAEDFDHNE
jgi:hypothetical protein